MGRENAGVAIVRRAQPKEKQRRRWFTIAALLAHCSPIPEKFVLFRRSLSLELYFFFFNMRAAWIRLFELWKFFLFRIDAYMREILFTHKKRERDAREAFDFYLVPGKFWRYTLLMPRNQEEKTSLFIFLDVVEEKKERIRNFIRLVKLRDTFLAAIVFFSSLFSKMPFYMEILQTLCFMQNLLTRSLKDRA